MRLPVAPSSYQLSGQALVRAVKQAGVVLARMTAEETDLDGAVAFTNPDRPDTRIANTAVDLRPPPVAQQAESLLQRLRDHYQQAGTCCFGLVRADTQEPHPHDTLTQAVLRAGYQPRKRWVYQLVRHTPPHPLNQDLQIIPARAAYAQTRRLFANQAGDRYPHNPRRAGDLVDSLTDHLDEPRLDVLLGRIAGEPVGWVGVLTLGQVGLIHGLYTSPSFRGRRVAPTLLTHAVELGQRAQFERIVVELPNGCPATPIYTASGFQPATSFTRYTLPTTPTTNPASR